MRVHMEGEGWVRSPLASPAFLLGGAASIMVWTGVVAVFLFLSGCADFTPNKHPGTPEFEAWRVKTADAIKVDVSQRVCSASDGKTTLVWGCR
jgi:hypothetical protein